MRRCIPPLFFSVLAASLPLAAQELAPARTLTFQLEYELYHDGDTMNLRIGLSDAMPAADVYLVVVFPTGGVASVIEDPEVAGQVAVEEGYMPIATDVVLMPFAPATAFT